VEGNGATMTGKKRSRPGDGESAEVVIVGGGMVGLTLAAALARGGFDVVLVDREAPADLLDAGFDGRASALALGSQRMLETLGLWRTMAGDAQPILEIRVSDATIWGGTSSLFLHYDHKALGDDPLGFIVENRVIRRVLDGHVRGIPRIRRIAPAEVDVVDRASGHATVRLADGRLIRAALVVAADGRRSRLREAAGIAVHAWDYPQCGIVCTVAHEKPHGAVAHEHFLPAGPFAMLPMTDGPQGEHRSSIVWTERRELAPAMMKLDAAEFAGEIARRFGDSLGRLRAIGGRWCYPLALSHAERYADHRLVLVGDAAHAIHPIAGQGLNLGLRDVAALAELLVDARRLGLDPGERAVLEGYQRWRRADSILLLAVTDGLNRLFSNDIGPLRLTRDMGLAAVNTLPPLKRLLMRHAMGLTGELPRLVRGEPL
jgi:2-octaprenyl-6-methoxyphenol hydroxylase